MTAEVVDGICAKRRRALFFGPGPGIIDEEVTSETQSWVPYLVAPVLLGPLRT